MCPRRNHASGLKVVTRALEDVQELAEFRFVDDDAPRLQAPVVEAGQIHAVAPEVLRRSHAALRLVDRTLAEHRLGDEPVPPLGQNRAVAYVWRHYHCVVHMTLRRGGTLAVQLGLSRYESRRPLHDRPGRYAEVARDGVPTEHAQPSHKSQLARVPARL